MADIKKGIITSSEKKIIAEISKEESVKKFLIDLKTFYLKYIAAMNETATKIEILSEDFKTRYDHSPIEHIESRIKEPESLMKKMMRNEIPFDINIMENRIFDIAGVRVICSFKQDIYDLVDMINKNEDIKVLRIKDYIANPKESGYRSYHMILSVPIYLTTGREEVPVELQIRTMAMDFWASLEHKIKYKYDGVVPLQIQKELIECSNTIATADEQMMKINNEIKKINL